MSVAARTTVATLCYESAPGFAFGTLLTEFEHALRDSGLPVDTRDHDQDDLAFYDLGGVQIGLGFADAQADGAPNRRPLACLTVAVGPGTPANAGVPTGRTGGALCASLVERVSAVCAPDEIVWTSRPEKFDAQLFDRVLAGIWPAEGENGSNYGTDEAAAAVDPKLIERLRDSVPVVWGRARQEREREREQAAARRAARLVDHAVANDRATMLHPTDDDLRRIRQALYAEDPAEPPRQPIERRLAITALNCALVMVSAPIGAAMLTHQILGRQSFATAARTLAVVSTSVGLGDIFLGGLPFI